INMLPPQRGCRGGAGDLYPAGPALIRELATRAHPIHQIDKLPPLQRPPCLELIGNHLELAAVATDELAGSGLCAIEPAVDMTGEFPVLPDHGLPVVWIPVEERQALAEAERDLHGGGKLGRLGEIAMREA